MRVEPEAGNKCIACENHTEFKQGVYEGFCPSCLSEKNRAERRRLEKAYYKKNGKGLFGAIKEG